MSDPTIPADPELDALRAAYPAWFIARAAFGGYRAEWKSENGLTIHYVAGISISDLHRRLEVLEFLGKYVDSSGPWVRLAIAQGRSAGW